MPANVIHGKDGTFFTIDTYNYLGRFKTHTITFEQEINEHTGPQDKIRHYTVLHSGWSATGTNYVGSGSAELLRSMQSIDTTAIGFQSNQYDGGTFNGSGYLSTVSGAAGAADNEEGWSFQGDGTWTFAA